MSDPAIYEIETDGMTYRQLYEAVEEHDEIIITIAEADVQTVKRGLTVYKSRLRRKQVSADLPTDETVLRFVELEAPADEKLAGFIKLHIICGAPKSIKIKKLELPDDTI